MSRFLNNNLYIFFICAFIYIFFIYQASSKNISEIDYYKEFIQNGESLNTYNDIKNYTKTQGEQFTIGSVSKSIFGASVLLFSQDLKNEYLFKGNRRTFRE